MKASALLLGAALFSSSLLHPSAVPAQAINRADLLGTWEGVPDEDPQLTRSDTFRLAKHMLVLRADSIWEELYTTKDGNTKTVNKGYWRVAEDSLIRGDWTKIALQNQRLSLSRPAFWLGKDKWYVVEAYQRAATPKQP